MNHALHKNGEISTEVFEFTKSIVKVYNLSKHGVNEDMQRERTFVPIDALIFYICARKLSNVLMRNSYIYIISELHGILDRFYIEPIRI